MGSMHRDRISSLPDEIITNILSFMPTKFAVGTSILSKRWIDLWKSVFNLDFDFGLQLHPNDEPRDEDSIAEFVCKVLHLCNSPKLQKFDLCCQFMLSNNSHLTNWIMEAVARNASEFYISALFLDLPMEFFTCKNITVLKLDGFYGVLTHVPPDVCFPCLKTLSISYFEMPFELVEKLISGCPILEDLSIDGEIQDTSEILTLNISAPVLKRLRIQLRESPSVDMDHRIFIDAPHLKCFHLDVRFFGFYMVKNLSSLYLASIVVGGWSSPEVDVLFMDRPVRAIRLLEDISSVTYLSLGCCTLGLTGTAFTDELPKFRALKRLEILFRHDCAGWFCLFMILESLPCLEILTLKKDHINGSFGIPGKLTFYEPESVPYCCLLHLQEVEIIGFDGDEHGQELVKYLLGIAKVLKKLRIISHGLTQDKERELLTQWSNCSRASTACEISFLGSSS